MTPVPDIQGEYDYESICERVIAVCPLHLTQFPKYSVNALNLKL
jgi:hypothetical protein